MGGLSIAGGLHLARSFLSESDAERTDNVSVGSLCLDESLNETVPLLDHGTSLVAADVHAVEVSVAVETLDLINLELELAPRIRLSALVTVTKRDCEHTSAKTVCRIHQTCSLVHWSQGDCTVINAWSQHVVPLLLSKGMRTAKYKLVFQSARPKRQETSPMVARRLTYAFFLVPFFLKLLGFFPAVMIDVKCFVRKGTLKNNNIIHSNFPFFP